MGTFLLVLAACVVIGGGGAGLLYKNSVSKTKAQAKAEAQAKSEEKESAESENAQETESAQEAKPAKTLSISNGKIMLDISNADGGTGVFAINEKGKKERLLSYSNGYVNSYFMLKIGNTQYVLRGSKQKNGVKCYVEESKSGARVFYVIEGKAQVAVDYTFVPNIATIYATIFITNIGDIAQTFTLKAVYDTFLGESSKADAFSFTGEAINERKQITEFKKDDWILSGNRRVKIAFVPLNTSSLNTLQSLTIGTPDDFLSRKWVPTVQEGKLFSSVYAFNDSAIALNWKDTLLERGESVVQSFVISAGVDGEEPDFVVANGAVPVKKKIEQASENVVKITSIAAAPIEKSQEPQKTAAEQKKVEGFIAVTDSQLDPSYIQSLLDRIASLKEDGSVDTSEIRRLSAELDAIFLKLRQKNETVNN